VAADRGSATTAIVNALKLSGINSRLSWGDDPREAAEAALSVAVDKISASGGTVPKKPKSKQGIGRLVNALLNAIHPIAQAIARIANRDDISLRTQRVSTKENATADAMSREGGHTGGQGSSGEPRRRVCRAQHRARRQPLATDTTHP
jgi:hypothetical protein